MAIINIGILAHVDAGKTSLTERILFETGVISSIGSVDKGTTQTDTLELERARGITIKSAVVSFQLNTLTVNLIDTPGHADFVAEVERSLRVLDGVVLVVSAVEGVQSQTRRLARAIRAAGLPLMIFVNKIDRLGARTESLLDDIRRKLDLRVVPMTTATGVGDRSAEVARCDRDDPGWHESLIDLLAEVDEQVIEEFDRSGGVLSRSFLDASLRQHIACAKIVPVYYGSAITGVGVSDVLSGVEELFPPAKGAADAPLDGAVFKIVRRSSGEKIVYLRLFDGSLSVRQRVVIRRRNLFGEIDEIEERITAVDRFAPGAVGIAEAVRAGEIVGLHGLRSARIGDRIGADESILEATPYAFPTPALESVVRPVDPGQITHLRSALEDLAEQDPLISLRQRNEEGEISVRLYGEVQKEVVVDTLSRDYGICVTFGPTQTICIERVVGCGEYVAFMADDDNPFVASIGIRIEPAEIGSGIRYVRELGSLPPAFYRAIEETVYETLTQGLSGWEVPDCTVTLTFVEYSSPVTVAADFRNLTPLVVMEALRLAGTQVCEPIEELQVEIPEDTFGAVCGVLINARATIRNTYPEGASHRIIADVPTVEVRSVEQQLPRLTRGDGGWVSHFSGYVPITSEAPTRKRTGPNPLNRAHYLAELARL